MTIILGCGVATMRGRILYEPQLLTGQIRYVQEISTMLCKPKLKFWKALVNNMISN